MITGMVDVCYDQLSAHIQYYNSKLIEQVSSILTNNKSGIADLK